VALYSHDAMGLGHMRRNLLIAQTLACEPVNANVLVISGACEAAAFPRPPGVDCLTLPALRKEADGSYHPRNLEIGTKELLEVRARTIVAALDAFQPDLLVVDKLPRGLGGELEQSLERLRLQGKTRCVLGLRDILDDPLAVRHEWQRQENFAAIRSYYEAVWVYGDPRVYDAARAYRFPGDVTAITRYTGYLDQRPRLRYSEVEEAEHLSRLALPPGKLVLCLVGGGQDGERLAQAFALAEMPAQSCGVIVTGPFMPAEAMSRLRLIAAARGDMKVLEFIAEPTLLLRHADAVVAMGGYNTVCEVLSYKVRALIVPRVKPRREQWIRAQRLRKMGALDLLHPDKVGPRLLSEWLAMSPVARPAVREAIDLNGLGQLPKLLDDVMDGRVLSTDGRDTRGTSYVAG
jgi:predicted glycosyltransferase